MNPARALRTVADLLRSATTRLADAGVTTARLDVEVLLASLLGGSRSRLYAELNELADRDLESRFAGLVERRASREPVAYITGTQEFWSLALAVTPAVLIPRPETELLVELTCRLLGDSAVARGGAGDRVPNPVVCDVGTGSGCVAVAVARELPHARIVACDVSADALAVARRNVRTHGAADRIELVRADVLDTFADGSLDLVVSNPPYLAPADAVSPETAFEPSGALFAATDGFDVVRRLIASAPRCLRRGGRLVMELGAGQERTVRDLAGRAGFRDVTVERDLAGLPRALVAGLA